ncbi:MAG TPA: lysylphosphatidylglycerol synthase transmembrane domain-containing protein [Eudoraea sp.]|nr:lysylphosphatidylglycerol synthase transmembrane domain-containing protein [Eudoraea sp.]
MANLRKKGITVLKVLVSAVLIYFIFTKIRLEDVLDILKKSHPFYLVLALVFFILSKVVAAVRLNGYFHQLNLFLTHGSNLKLYLLGMFYNLFLPGGIGGDAYKGYLIKKKFGMETKKVISVLVLDRLSGLLLLYIYASVLALFLDAAVLVKVRILVGPGIFISLLFFWILNKKYFSFVLPVFWKSFGYSALVQLAQLCSVFCILKSMHLEGATIAYLFIFLISSIIAVLPMTIGGIGSREVVFLYGALWLGLDENTSVGISVVFFLLTAAVSLAGIIFHAKRPELKITEHQ